jgi:hypothetical protein
MRMLCNFCANADMSEGVEAAGFSAASAAGIDFNRENIETGLPAERNVTGGDSPNAGGGVADISEKRVSGGKTGPASRDVEVRGRGLCFFCTALVDRLEVVLELSCSSVDTRASARLAAQI